MKCVICNQKKGKRLCKLNANKHICSLCCGAARNNTCEGCSYYESSKEYRKEKDILSKKFITPIMPDVEDKCDEALKLVERGKIKQGQKLLEELLYEHPNYHMVLYGVGVCHAVQDEIDEAIEYFKKAVDIFPLFTEAYFNLANAYYKKINLASALENLKVVIKLDGKDGEYGKQAQDIIDHVENVINNSTSLSVDAFLENQKTFDKAYAALRRSEFKTAISLFNQVLKLEKEHVQSYGNLGIAYAGLGERKKAIENFDKALSIDPKYEPAILNKQIAIEMKEGEPDDFGKIIETNYYDLYRRDE